MMILANIVLSYRNRQGHGLREEIVVKKKKLKKIVLVSVSSTGKETKASVNCNTDHLNEFL